MIIFHDYCAGSRSLSPIIFKQIKEKTNKPDFALSFLGITKTRKKRGRFFSKGTKKQYVNLIIFFQFFFYATHDTDILNNNKQTKEN